MGDITNEERRFSLPSVKHFFGLMMCRIKPLWFVSFNINIDM